MYTYEYPRPAVTADVVVFTFQEDELRILLVQRKHDPFAGEWALPGGFVEIDEGLDDAARRELQEETGVADVYCEQLYTFGRPDRDPRGRVITVAYLALLSRDQAAQQQMRAGDDAGDARWWNIHALPTLAFDHAPIVEYALQRLRWKLEWTALGFLMLPEQFTLSELQRVYETVLDQPLDKRNFRRKMLSATTQDNGRSVPVLEETGRYQAGGHRPARLYRFSAKAIELAQVRRRFP
jgi:8-oxo-dGTP diphosphatase